MKNRIKNVKCKYCGNKTKLHEKAMLTHISCSKCLRYGLVFTGLEDFFPVKKPEETLKEEADRLVREFCKRDVNNDPHWKKLKK